MRKKSFMLCWIGACVAITWIIIASTALGKISAHPSYRIQQHEYTHEPVQTGKSVFSPESATDLWLSSSAPPAQTMSIIGGDERMRIHDTTQSPYNLIALISSEFITETITCTGWFIGLDSIVTSARCLYMPTRDEWATEVSVIPGANESLQPFGVLTSTVYHVPDMWHEYGLETYDYGAVRLPSTSLGDQVGYFSYAYHSDYYVSNKLPIVTLAGYPGDKAYGQLWLSTDLIDSSSTRVLRYMNDTYSGQHGSPIWEGIPGFITAIAIHSESIGEPLCEAGVNCGIRISPEVAENLVAWGAAEPPQTDCLTLNVLIEPSHAGSVIQTAETSSGCMQGQLYDGFEVSLTATANEGYVFHHWGGELEGSQNPITITMSYSITTTAYFTPSIPGPLSLSSMTIDDGVDSSGNDDGVANCGERIALEIQVHNTGLQPALDVTATLTTSNVLIDIVQNDILVGDIASQSTMTGTEKFLVTIQPGHEGTFDSVLGIWFRDGNGETWYDSGILDIYCPIQNAPPYPPADPFPEHQATDQVPEVILSWSGGDPDGEVVYYDVYFEAEDSSPDLLLCAGTVNTTCDPGVLVNNRQYYWQVIARDSTGAVVVGPIWTFHTQLDNQSPYEPSSPSPADGAPDVYVDVALNWVGGDPDGDQVTYNVYLRGESSQSFELICGDITLMQCTPSTLENGITYLWYVTATDEHFAHTTSEEWCFSTENLIMLYIPMVLHD